jgi:hypothetical protein
VKKTRQDKNGDGKNQAHGGHGASNDLSMIFSENRYPLFGIMLIARP